MSYLDKLKRYEQREIPEGSPPTTEPSATSSTSDSITIEPAFPTARPIYWESEDGTWHGPAKPEYLGRTGTGDKERFLAIVSYNGTILLIRSDLLRSRQAFEAQGTR